jgi:hypothetical protein
VWGDLRVLETLGGDEGVSTRCRLERRGEKTELEFGFVG